MKAFLIVILLFSFKSYAANQCMDLFKDSQKTVSLTNAELNDLTIEIDAFIKSYELPYIITGALKPNWNDYNKLMGLIEKTENLDEVQINKIAVNMKFASKIISESTKDIIEQIKAVESKNKVFNRFLDYNYSYFILLEQLNIKLKSQIIPVPSFKEIPTEKQLIDDGIKIVKNLEKIVKTRFAETGFENMKALETELLKHDPKLKGLLKLVEKDLVVTMRRPENGRFWIPIAGFQNQRITGSSKGYYGQDSNGEHISMRDEDESRLTSIEIKEYVNSSPRLKSNYAEARPSFESHIEFKSDAGQYGPDLWIIKKNVIKERATWTPQDSLRNGDYKFIPWLHRKFMTLFAGSDYLEHNKFMADDSILDFKNENSLLGWKRGRSYFEVQIFGPLSINDVEAFHFTNNPPDKKLYELLKSKGIKVFDTRNNQNKEYFGEESQ